MSGPARTPEPPYWAVIFTSTRAPGDDERYEATADRMLELAARQPGFLGADTARNAVGITVSYWADEAAIAAWKRDAAHTDARAAGRADWYDRFEVRVARVERAYGFDRDEPRP